MPTQPLRFRPTLQFLETRRLMAGDVGLEDAVATPQEPVTGKTPVVAIAISDDSQVDHDESLTNVPFHRVINNTIYGGNVEAGNPVDEVFAQYGGEAPTAADVLVLIGPNGEPIYTSDRN